MNTNNKEAIELLEVIIVMTQKESAVIPDLARDAIELLQDNEDIEVQEKTNLKQVPCTCHTSMTHVEADLDRAAQSTYGEILKKPSSKVEKLKELQEEIGGGGYGKDYIHPMCDLIDILLEDEE